MKKILALFALLVLVGLSPFMRSADADSPCTVTISPGGSAASQIQTAVNSNLGTQKTICLEAGSYGSVSLNSMARSAFAEIRSTSGQTASIAPQVSGSKFIRFRNLTFSGSIDVGGCSQNIQFVNSAFVGNTRGMRLDGGACPTTPQNYLIDGVDFTNTGANVNEGRLSLSAAHTGIVRNSLFAGHTSVPDEGGDGVHLTGEAQFWTIGPGNEFRDMPQDPCDDPGGVEDAHCDPIQIFDAHDITITGNYFHGNSTGLLLGVMQNITITHNILRSEGYDNQIYIFWSNNQNTTISHNTLTNGANIHFQNDARGTAVNATVQNNVISGTISKDGTLSWSSPTITHNLVGTNPGVGTNTIIGFPTFTGGAAPSTWAGHMLTSGSLGKGNASDAQDRGTNYFRPAAPSNFQFN